MQKLSKPGKGYKAISKALKAESGELSQGWLVYQSSS